MTFHSKKIIKFYPSPLPARHIFAIFAGNKPHRVMPQTLFCDEPYPILLDADPHPEVVLIQPTDRREITAIDRLTAHIRAATSRPFAFAAIEIADWVGQLAPWPDAILAPHADAGHGATDTLAHIETTLLPLLTRRFGPLPCILGGYSLAALFALWASTVSPSFAAVAAASPSVWMERWPQHLQNHTPQTAQVYLSLGDLEEKTRHPGFARIGANIRTTREQLVRVLGKDRCVLEWNTGNHFAHVTERTARGFAWCMNHLHTFSS